MLKWKRSSEPDVPKEPDFWEQELTPEEEEELLRKAALEIKRRKLESPAIWFLEMHKPLSYVAANSSVALSPFLVPLLGYDFVHNYSRLFCKRENVERLIQKIEMDTSELNDSTEDKTC